MATVRRIECNYYPVFPRENLILLSKVVINVTMVSIGIKKPKQERSYETVESIFKAVTHILEKEGPSKLNTNNIAQVAGVSIGSLYQYFKNKESIFESLLLRMTETNLFEFENIISKIDKKDVTRTQIVRVIVETQFGTIRKMKKLNKLLFQYAPQLLSKDHFKKADERIVKFLMEQFKNNDVELKTEKPEIVIFMCVQTLRAVIFMTLLNRSEEEYDLITEELIQMISKYLEDK